MQPQVESEQVAPLVPTPELPTAETPAPHPLAKLLIANLVVTCLLLVSVIGFGSYLVIQSLPATGVTKQAEVKVVAAGGEIAAFLNAPELTDQVVLSNTGTAKTWTVAVPFGARVAVTIKTDGSVLTSHLATCAITVDGVVADTQSLALPGGQTVCSWTNDRVS